jgi:hypothetical protein
MMIVLFQAMDAASSHGSSICSTAPKGNFTELRFLANRKRFGATTPWLGFSRWQFKIFTPVPSAHRLIA